MEEIGKTVIRVLSHHFYEFGPFRLDASAPLLLRSGDLVPLPPKALDVLVVLVDKRGTLVSRDELVSAVWPDTFVEESNLGHHISLLRKTLGNVDNGQPYIETISKRGYRFTGPVRQAAVDAQLPNADCPPAPVLHTLTEVVPIEPSVMSSDDPTTILSIPSNVATRTHASPLRWGVTGALLGLVLASAVGWLALRNRDVAPNVAQFTVSLPPGEVLDTPGHASAAVLSPDGTRLVYAARRDGQSQLYLRSFGELEAKPIPETRGAMSPFFSPDGQWVGFWQAFKLKKIALAGGEPVTICDSEAFWGASWGSDDNILFVRKTVDAIVSVPASGGDPKIVAAVDRRKGEFRFRWPELLPGGDAMLFTVGRDSIESSDDNIVVQSLKTGDRKVLIEGGMGAHYSPSGHLVYGRAGALFAAPFDLKRLAITGAAVSVKQGVLVSPITGAVHFNLSSNGSLAYVPGASLGNKRLPVWVDRDGNAQPLPLPPRAYSHPRISPDGRQVAMEVESPAHNLFTYDLARGVLTQVTLDGGSLWPVWAPDSKRLAFSSLGRPTMWSIPVDRSGPVERLTSIGVGHRASSWSPDGRVIAFDSDDDSGAGDVGVLEMDPDRKPRPFAATRFAEGSPKFSPDSRWIAYSSNESGRNEIYAQAYPGPGPKLQISIGGGTDPVWARDGKELFYRNGDNMMVVEIRLKPSLAPGKPRVLWTGRYARGLSSQGSPAGVTNSNYDVTPDGQRFLMIQEEEDGLIATVIHVLPNWSQDLKRQLQQEHAH